MNEINCATTVLLLRQKEVGVVRRDKNETSGGLLVAPGGLLVAPGGKVELEDGILVEDVKYFSVEEAAIREVEEETGILLTRDDLRYFCSLVLPNNRIVISFYACTNEYSDRVIYLSKREIIESDKFALGMKTEILMLLDSLTEKGEW